MNKINNYVKIFIILITSYFISSFFIKNIFLANSPKVRQNLDTYFLARLNFDSLLPQNNSFVNQAQQQVINTLKEDLKPVAKGVNAAAAPGYGYTVFKIKEIQWGVATCTTKNGKIVTIQYPLGTNPPSCEIYNTQFSQNQQ